MGKHCPCEADTARQGDNERKAGQGTAARKVRRHKARIRRKPRAGNRRTVQGRQGEVRERFESRRPAGGKRFVLDARRCGGNVRVFPPRRGGIRDSQAKAYGMAKRAAAARFGDRKRAIVGRARHRRARRHRRRA